MTKWQPISSAPLNHKAIKGLMYGREIVVMRYIGGYFRNVRDQKIFPDKWMPLADKDIIPSDWDKYIEELTNE